MTITVGGTSITFNDSTTQSTAATGTVTSVATGNGLSGGTITTSGTLTIAAPSANTVGCYMWGIISISSNQSVTYGSNYSPGTGDRQITWVNGWESTIGSSNSSSGMSGTWKYMGRTFTAGGCGNSMAALFCRAT